MAVPRTRGAIAIHEDQEQPGQSFDEDSGDELNESLHPLDDSGQTRSEESEDEDDMEDSVVEDMQRFELSFKGITSRYKLINRIGEGTFSTVYKAEDLLYNTYKNSWDYEKENIKLSPSGRKYQRRYHRPHYVAIKKIYVTSSPMRILNELELLHDLRHCDSICPLITAFRHQDQVIAILPYFKHLDFRVYFRDMEIADMRPYFRSIFKALQAVHAHDILHRDIKPTNFLYDTRLKRGVLVDFGLAERQETDTQPCMCLLSDRSRESRYKSSYYMQQDFVAGFPEGDKRPSLRANRAGTRGFRAPEVLFKCTAQTTAIDIWAVGVILLTILSKRFPFFNSSDDIDAVIELSTVFGRNRMRDIAKLHGQAFDTNIPTITDAGHPLDKVILWCTERSARRGASGERLLISPDEMEAVQFLEACLVLDPAKRITAAKALEHPFLTRTDDGSEYEMDDLSRE